MRGRIILTIVYDFQNEAEEHVLLTQLSNLGTLELKTDPLPYPKFENSRIVDFYFALNEALGYSAAVVAMTASIAAEWTILNAETPNETECVFNRSAGNTVVHEVYQSIRWAHIQPQYFSND